MSIDNLWIVVPVNNLSTNADSMVSSLTGGFVAPAKFTVSEHPLTPEAVAQKKVPEKRKEELLKRIEDAKLEKTHPHYGEAGLNFSNRIVFVNNEPGYTTYPGVINVEDFGPVNVAKNWNKGIDYAVEHGADSVLVLRSISDLDPWMIKDAYDALFLTNNEIAWLSGSAFIIKATSTLRADEQFNVWWFDIDLNKRSEGKSMIVPCEYSTVKEIDTLKLTPELIALTAEDKTQFYTKWNLVI